MKHNSVFQRLLAFSLLVFSFLALSPRSLWATTADQYLNDANDAIQKRDWQGAIQDFNEALKLKPANLADCYVGRGFTYDSMGKFELAIPDYLQALKLSPRN